MRIEKSNRQEGKNINIVFHLRQGQEWSARGPNLLGSQNHVVWFWTDETHVHFLFTAHGLSAC